MTKIIDLIAKSIYQFAIINDCDVFGQNLFKPSYISGLGKFLVQEDGNTPLRKNWFDATNSELTSVGYGLGRAIANKNTLLIVKQQDFLYLAIDQFVNTINNCIDEDKLKGKFRIICLVSDIPKEGTQAYSNNISLFSNISESINVDYCFSPEALKKSLNNNYQGLTISFLSTEYTYKSNIFLNYKFKDTNNNLFTYGDDSLRFDIIVGFIPEKYLSNIFKKKSKFLYPVNLNNNDWINELNKFIEHIKPKDIFIHESSSSNYAFSDHIYKLIKSRFETVNVSINNYKRNKEGSFSLKKQRT